MGGTDTLRCKVRKIFVICAIFSCFLGDIEIAAKEQDDPYASLKKKKVVDYTDADLERLFDQWEEGDEPLEDDELPEWKRPRPQIDLSKMDPNDPESMLKMSKKGQTLMMFATVSGEPSEQEAEQITLIWATSLFNANYELQRYMVGSNRVLFTVKDGSKAWEIKDYLVQQERCELVTIEGKDYYGKGSKNYAEPEKTKKSKKSTDDQKTDDSKTQKKKTKSKEENKKKKNKKDNEVKPEREDL